MVDAEIVVLGQGNGTSWGKWSFPALPANGHRLGVRAADGTAFYLRVRDVEHRPARDGETGIIAILICDREGEDLLDGGKEALLKMQPIARSMSTEETFTSIYKSNYWGDIESVSGPGSTLGYTKNLRKYLPALFARYDIRTVFDAPSGDFNWMAVVLKEAPVNYIGGEIVQDLVKQSNERHASNSVRFVHFDITRDTFPKADLWLCRDCLFHFPYAEIKKTLDQFVASEIAYVLTTTHVNNGFLNRDIPMGLFRMIDLFSPPFNFPQSALERIEDWIPGFPQRLVCLWSREQVAQALRAGGL